MPPTGGADAHVRRAEEEAAVGEPSSETTVGRRSSRMTPGAEARWVESLVSSPRQGFRRR